MAGFPCRTQREPVSDASVTARRSAILKAATAAAGSAERAGSALIRARTMHAATQHNQVTMRPVQPWLGLLRPLVPHPPGSPALPPAMTTVKPRQFYIHGLTLDGSTFRPSDWAERLAGAMSSFRPGGSSGGIGAFIGYSPYCVPQVVDSVKCVLVSEALKGIEPMAWDFVMNFARDNQLQVADVCVLLDAVPARKQ